mmetsp:Transcript_60576/g.170685  ORF Transcript_60576/g.170685 Transcript_60576/m.170685 type:complete len:257 (-) Transcript_60576:1121-1891(-)
MASTFLPGTMALSAELSPPRMFWPMISAPASPKPRASREPILIIVFSRTTVSMGSGPSRPGYGPCRHLVQHLIRASFALRRVNRRSTGVGATEMVSSWGSWWSWCSWGWTPSSLFCSSSPIVIAARGLVLIRSIFAIIRSMGASTSRFASLENVMAPKPRSRQMKTVWNVFSIASIREPLRRSKTNMNRNSPHSSLVSIVGYTTARSWKRRFSGQTTRSSWNLMSEMPRMVPMRHLSVALQGPLMSLNGSSVRLHW